MNSSQTSVSNDLAGLNQYLGKTGSTSKSIDPAASNMGNILPWEKKSRTLQDLFSAFETAPRFSFLDKAGACGQQVIIQTLGLPRRKIDIFDWQLRLS